MKVVITIPAFNEERTISRVIADIKDAMSTTSYHYQILVLDDGSKDQTVKFAKKSGARVVSNRRNRGLAFTFKREMEECLAMGADIIVHTDADGQYPAKHIPELLAKVEQGYDLVLGSRFIRRDYRGAALKNIGNRIFTSALSRIVGTKLTDSTTGFRAFVREIAEEIDYINTFTYTHEQIIRAKKQRFRIGEIPITTRRTRESRLFKSPLQYAVRAWTNIFRIYRDYDPLKFFGYCSLAFFSLGTLFAIWILVTLAFTGGVGGIPRVILCALCYITGTQILLFGFLADMQRR